MKWDVAIVGGGPAGCFLGKLLAQKGLEVAIIEEHGEIGNPVCCAGIVGASGLKELGVRPGRWVLERLKRAVIFPPSGEPVEIGRGKLEAFVVDRTEFDRSLETEAAEAGATFLLKTKCVGVKFGKEQTLLLEGASGGELKTRLVVGADGPASVIARKSGLSKPGGETRCAQVECHADVSPGTAEVYLGRKFAPGFFGWSVRAGEVSRIGLGATEGNPVTLLRSFLRDHPIISCKFNESRILSSCAALIPAPFSSKVCSDGVLLVGDAAGHVKPLTGGGIYMGLSCARIAAPVVAEALRKEPSKKVLQHYERGIKKKFGMEIELGLRARRAFCKMSDEDLEVLVGLLRDEEVRKIVSENFDFDDHGKLLRALLVKAPGILRKVGTKRLLRVARLFLG
jgi:geranylgeranyl reductase family protein